MWSKNFELALSRKARHAKTPEPSGRWFRYTIKDTKKIPKIKLRCHLLTASDSSTLHPPISANCSSRSFSMNGIKCPTAFFMTRADLITCWLEKAPFQYRNTLFQTNEKAFSQLLGVHFISRYFYEYSTIILRFYVIFTNILQLFYEGARDMKW